MTKELYKEDLDRIQTDIDYFRIGDYFMINGVKYTIVGKECKREVVTREPTRKTQRKVSFNEFIEYINNYPYHLTRNITGICEPPLITYNDFSLGNWPDSIVASYYDYSDNPNHYYYTAPEDREFYVYDIEEGYIEEKPAKHVLQLQMEP